MPPKNILTTDSTRPEDFARLQSTLWEDSAEVPGLDPAEWRMDQLGRLMNFGDLGASWSIYGWTIGLFNCGQNDEDRPSSLAAINFETQELLSRNANSMSPANYVADAVPNHSGKPAVRIAETYLSM